MSVDIDALKKHQLFGEQLQKQGLNLVFMSNRLIVLADNSDTKIIVSELSLAPDYPEYKGEEEVAGCGTMWRTTGKLPSLVQRSVYTVGFATGIVAILNWFEEVCDDLNNISGS